MRANSWFPPGRVSCLNPSPTSVGGPLLPPPFPPDPSDTLSDTVQFPPLSPSLPPSSSFSPFSSSTLALLQSALVPKEPAKGILSLPGSQLVHKTLSLPSGSSFSSSATVATVAAENPRSALPLPSSIPLDLAIFFPFDSTSSCPPYGSPLLSCSTRPVTIALPSAPDKRFEVPTADNRPLPPSSDPIVASMRNKGLTPSLVTVPASSFSSQADSGKLRPSVQAVPETLVSKIKKLEDKSLKRMAPAIESPSGTPSVVIPDEVFDIATEIHKDFLVGFFLGNLPAYNQIQSVFSHMWGKGRRVEIHTNLGARKVLFRIPNESLRKKILEQRLWHVGSSMFHVVQWTNKLSTAPVPKTIPLWAHLKGVPFSLMHRVGLSWIAGLLGEPIDRDDFTMNLVSVSEAHVRIDANLSKPLPSQLEIIRTNGEVIKVLVEYPWTPPECSHCHQIGHLIRHCPDVTIPCIPKETAKTNTSSSFVENNGLPPLTVQSSNHVILQHDVSAPSEELYVAPPNSEMDQQEKLDIVAISITPPKGDLASNCVTTVTEAIIPAALPLQPLPHVLLTPFSPPSSFSPPANSFVSPKPIFSSSINSFSPLSSLDMDSSSLTPPTINPPNDLISSSPVSTSQPSTSISSLSSSLHIEEANNPSL